MEVLLYRLLGAPVGGFDFDANEHVLALKRGLDILIPDSTQTFGQVSTSQGVVILYCNLISWHSFYLDLPRVFY